MAAACAALATRSRTQLVGSGGEYHARCPVCRLTACKPAGCRREYIRHRKVCLFGIDSRTPFDAAERAADAGAILPNNLAPAGQESSAHPIPDF